MTNNPTIATIGNFDGVHPGHKRLVNAVLADCTRRSRETGIPHDARVFTFSPHPATLFKREMFRPVCTEERRTRLLQELGDLKVSVLTFDKAFAIRSADDFCRELCEEYCMVKLFVGYDFHMGSDKAGYAELAAIAKKRGFDLESVPAAALEDGTVIGSSAIRTALDEGDAKRAALLLGRPHMLEGTVERGDGRGGSLLGFPTANLSEQKCMVPRNGVYASRCRIIAPQYRRGKGYFEFEGVTNIGTLPTFRNGICRTIETHLLDFKDDIYGMHIEIDFLDRIRDEKRFESVNELREQIARDAMFRRSLCV